MTREEFVDLMIEAYTEALGEYLSDGGRFVYYVKPTDEIRMSHILGLDWNNPYLEFLGWL